MSNTDLHSVKEFCDYDWPIQNASNQLTQEMKVGLKAKRDSLCFIKCGNLNDPIGRGLGRLGGGGGGVSHNAKTNASISSSTTKRKIFDPYACACACAYSCVNPVFTVKYALSCLRSCLRC